MNPKNKDNRPNERLTIRYAYLIIVFFLMLTGFGQMPIFKRYYIADIPGLGWLAKFYITHYLHYLFAILLIALTSYVVTEYLINNRKRFKVTISGFIQGALVSGLVITGILLVIRNLAGFVFWPGFIIFLDIGHIGLVMVLLMTEGYLRLAGGSRMYILCSGDER